MFNMFDKKKVPRLSGLRGEIRKTASDKSIYNKSYSKCNWSKKPKLLTSIQLRYFK